MAMTPEQELWVEEHIKYPKHQALALDALGKDEGGSVYEYLKTMYPHKIGSMGSRVRWGSGRRRLLKILAASSEPATVVKVLNNYTPRDEFVSPAGNALMWAFPFLNSILQANKKLISVFRSARKAGADPSDVAKAVIASGVQPVVDADDPRILLARYQNCYSSQAVDLLAQAS